MTALVVAAVFALLAAAGLVAWRWWLSDRAATRAHGLELHARQVVVDQAAIDGAVAKVRALEERVKSLEYKR